MVLSFHGFSFDLFGLSRRQPTEKPREISRPPRIVAQGNSQADQDKAEQPEVSFRGLCIFPIL